MSETEPEVEETEAEENEDSSGVPGQIQYPERVVDAERAGQFVAGDVDTLEPENDDSEGEEGEGDEE